ncbi:hypothetical protein [Amycolatopsis pigmentata]|uniref:WXG100 family type VII secretion target n=1 Tax=Amycolatopsis pigmentata TaxID=450801 RepID=A0ABW5G1Q5_9PSEU
MDDMHGQYGYDDSTLIAVINATETAIQNMNHLNSEVQAMSAALPVVNNSASGQKLAARISDWTADFNQVIGALTDLNGKANDNLKVLRGVSTHTAQQS